MKKQDKVLVWSDDKGEYKLGYSQYMQRKILRVNTMLLIAVVLLTLVIVVGFGFAWHLVGRIDALDPLSKLAAFLLI